jgi:putrescine transport system substrate-binding protein
LTKTARRRDTKQMKLCRLVFAILLFAALAGAKPACAENQVNILGWADYVDPHVLEDFTKETGIKVVYDTFDSETALESQLANGNGQYDVVMPSATSLHRLIRDGLLQPLDMSRLPNAKNLWPQIMAQLARDDPGNQYAVNYMWYTAGIAYDADKAKDRLGDVTPDSWDIVFQPDNLAKFADCGVDVLDDPHTMFALALIYLKRNPATRNFNDLHRAADLLAGLHRNITRFTSSDYVSALGNGDICLAVGWSGDASQARRGAEEADNGTELGDATPKEGSVLGLDNLAIPKDAPHVAAAYVFLDYLMRPEIAARNSEATGFASGVLAAKALLPPDLAGNKAIYPDDDTMARLFALTNPDPMVERYITRVWSLIKSAK